ncbi:MULTISPECIES: cell division protein ZapA [Pseudovibrio]|uniref:cell division protein ZapA n=1 Tax=Stappiaceae TaxID=2821832 RepID=UPI002365AF68|nr:MULTISPECIES: cell division protein ZapA [Pseudovibrio]MDD7911906.1 cell division protein ZapA [Pseudovibrio exalbescens]MDX5595428.1 cell division protein ZapA [Pseudovibrio sp. SPO723]
MPQITVSINGRSFRMACDEGEEERLLGLAKKFDDNINMLRGSFGEIGDLRLTVMAGIMATDQASEAVRRAEKLASEKQELEERLEIEKAALQQKLEGMTEARSGRERELAGKVGEVAGQIEKLADKLANMPGSSVENNEESDAH